MESKERIRRILAGEPVDRIGVFEEFWTDTERRWIGEGHVKNIPPHPLYEHFAWDIEKPWPFNFNADVRVGERVLSETEDTILVVDGNGATLRKHKKHVSTPEHVAFACSDRESWEKLIKPLYLETPIRERIDIEHGYLPYKQRAERSHSYILLGSWHIFQNILNVCGHRNLLYGMGDDPEWVDDMFATIAELSLKLHEELFSMVGKPDALYIMEDMGYKNSPFFSPRMFRRYFKGIYRSFVDFAHSHGLPVFFHSCGFIEPLLPDLVDTGIDCLTAMEHKAGMDVMRIAKNYGDRIALMGGLDMRALESNDLARVDRLLEDTIPYLKNYRYILASDHSTSPAVNYETFTHFIEKGLALGTY